MNLPSEPEKRRQTLKICLAVSLLSLVPHWGRGTDISDGLRVGTNYSTNPVYSNAIQLGQGTLNPSLYSVAVGTSNNMGGSGGGFGSIAVGSSNTLTGYTKFAFGTSNVLTGSTSMAMGSSNTVGGSNSLVYGSANQTLSTASQALAGGSSTIAAGQNSVALGFWTTANSYASVVIGRYNDSVGTEATDSAAKTTWRDGTSSTPNDSLFVIGNGTKVGSTVYPSNAMLVTKDGTVTIKKIPPQGSVGMGAFTAQ